MDLGVRGRVGTAIEVTSTLGISGCCMGEQAGKHAAASIASGGQRTTSQWEWRSTKDRPSSHAASVVVCTLPAEDPAWS